MWSFDFFLAAVCCGFLCTCICVLATGWFYDHSHADRLGGGLDSLGSTINHRTNILEIRLEGSLGFRGDLDAHATQVLGSSTIALAVSAAGPSTEEVTDARHGDLQDPDCPGISRSIEAATPGRQGPRRQRLPGEA